MNGFDEKKLAGVNGGTSSMTNPVAGMTREQAEYIAAELDKGTYEGPFSTMTGNEFMKWWAKANNESVFL